MVSARATRYKKSSAGTSARGLLTLSKSQLLAATPDEVHKRTMVSLGLHRRSATLARALTLLMVFALLLPSLDANARRRKPRRAKRASKPTRLVIYSTTERAEIEIDGKLVGETPMEEGLPISPGDHTIRVSKRGWTEHIDTFEASQGETVELEIDLIPVAGIVRITTPAAGATIEVNGKVVGVTPFDQDIPVGVANIRVTQSGYHDVLKTLDIQVGRLYDLELAQEALPIIARPKPGTESLSDQWWFWTAISGVVAGSAWAVAALLAADETHEPPEPHTTIVIP